MSEVFVEGLEPLGVCADHLARALGPYCQRLTRPVSIQGYNRGVWGGYTVVEARSHEIRINLWKMRKIPTFTSRRQSGTHTIAHKDGVVYQTISTILHEIRHCQQYEADPRWYRDPKADRDPSIRGAWCAYYWSDLECDARAYAERHVRAAVARYYKLCG